MDWTYKDIKPIFLNSELHTAEHTYIITDINRQYLKKGFTRLLLSYQIGGATEFTSVVLTNQQFEELFLKKVELSDFLDEDALFK